MSTGVVRIATAVVVVALAVTVVASWGIDRAVAAHCAAFTELDQTAVDPDVWVIGDSYAEGGWARQIPGAVTVDAIGGSGYTATRFQKCDDVRFADRTPAAAAARPSLVILQGGLNDVEATPAEVAKGVRRALAALDGAQVVMVGPTSPPARAGQVGAVDRALAAVARREGVPYLRTAGWDLPWSSDRVHLTAAGYEAFGNRVAHWVGTR